MEVRGEGSLNRGVGETGTRGRDEKEFVIARDQVDLLGERGNLGEKP